MTKICSKCGKELSVDCFGFAKKSTGLLKAQCNKCIAEYEAAFREQNKDAMADKQREWAERNRKEYRQYQTKWKRDNQEHWREYNKRKLQDDKNHHLRRIKRSRLYCAMFRGVKGGSAVKNLGCTIDQLKLHLESLFLPGMSWGNYGEWHIDHKLPLAHFDLRDPRQVAEACNYTNLQPLWAEDNLKKSDKILL